MASVRVNVPATVQNWLLIGRPPQQQVSDEAGVSAIDVVLDELHDTVIVWLYVAYAELLGLITTVASWLPPISGNSAAGVVMIVTQPVVASVVPLPTVAPVVAFLTVTVAMQV